VFACVLLIEIKIDFVIAHFCSIIVTDQHYTQLIRA
jgi:hypothetical protein